MRTELCDALDIEFPIFGFSHCRDVVAAVSRAGGFGILGAGGLDGDELDQELTLLDQETNGRPYGVDLVIPARTMGEDAENLAALIPQEHIHFLEELYERFSVPRPAETDWRIRGHNRATAQLDVALGHRVSMVATALGPPPESLVKAAHANSILIAGLVGSPEHVVHQLAAGTDVLVAQGTEAGGHTGEIATLVLVPQVVDAAGGNPVLAAGGIGSGRQLAAALALGAQGGWLGSIWLTTLESDLHPVIKAKLLAASSRDTVRSRCRTGKPVRQLRTPWVDAWDSPDTPDPLPTPLQQMLVRPQLESISRYGIAEPAGSAVGQIVGMMSVARSVRSTFEELVLDAVAAMERVSSYVD